VPHRLPSLSMASRWLASTRLPVASVYTLEWPAMATMFSLAWVPATNTPSFCSGALTRTALGVVASTGRCHTVPLPLRA